MQNNFSECQNYAITKTMLMLEYRINPTEDCKNRLESLQTQWLTLCETCTLSPECKGE